MNRGAFIATEAYVELSDIMQSLAQHYIHHQADNPAPIGPVRRNSKSCPHLSAILAKHSYSYRDGERQAQLQLSGEHIVFDGDVDITEIARAEFVALCLVNKTSVHVTQSYLSWYDVSQQLRSLVDRVSMRCARSIMSQMTPQKV